MHITFILTTKKSTIERAVRWSPDFLKLQISGYMQYTPCSHAHDIHVLYKLWLLCMMVQSHTQWLLSLSCPLWHSWIEHWHTPSGTITGLVNMLLGQVSSHRPNGLFKPETWWSWIVNCVQCYYQFTAGVTNTKMNELVYMYNTN